MFYKQLHNWLIRSVSELVILCENIFKTLAEILRQWSPPTTCHMSHITCHMSHVSFLFLFIIPFFWQNGGATWWRVCYQKGLPHLVLVLFNALMKKHWFCIHSLYRIVWEIFHLLRHIITFPSLIKISGWFFFPSLTPH